MGVVSSVSLGEFYTVESSEKTSVGSPKSRVSLIFSLRSDTDGPETTGQREKEMGQGREGRTRMHRQGH